MNMLLQLLDCKEPPTIENGACTPQPDTWVGANCTYQCEPGYALSGTATIYCRKDTDLSVAWDVVVPTCSSKYPLFP